MTQTIQKQRIEWVDVFRGFGILFMILGHVAIGKAFDVYIHAFHMPLFFFVTGYFWGTKRKPYTAFLLHDLRTLMLPYMVFFLLFQPLHYIYTRHYDIGYAVLSFFTSNHNRIDVSGALWFLLCLFTCKQVFYWLERWLRGWALAAVVCVLTLAGNFMPWKLPLCLDSALSCLAVLYIGRFVRQHSEHRAVNRVINLPWWAVLVCMALSIGTIFWNIPVNIRTNTFGNPLLYWIACLLSILCWLHVAKYVEMCPCKPMKWISRALQYLGKNSIVYLTLNEMAIAGMLFILGFLGVGMDAAWPPAVFFALKAGVFVGTMIFITVACLVVKKTKLKYLFGMK